jgi:hypothetical protein
MVYCNCSVFRLQYKPGRHYLLYQELSFHKFKSGCLIRTDGESNLFAFAAAEISKTSSPFSNGFNPVRQ